MPLKYVKKNFTIPSKLLEKMDKEAERFQMNRSEFIRHLFVSYLEKKEEEREYHEKGEESTSRES